MIRRITFIILLLKSCACFAGVLSEGMCLKSPSHPQIIMRINSVGGVSGLLMTNISGSQPIPFNKAQLEDEISAGVKVEVSCAEFNNPSNTGQQTTSKSDLDLFGIKLSEPYDTFKKSHAGIIQSCNDEQYKQPLGMSNGKDVFSEASIPVKKCVTNDKVHLMYADQNGKGVFTLAELERDYSKTDVTLGVVLKKLTEKAGGPLKEAGLSDKIYEFASGYISIGFRYGDYTQNDESKLRNLRWWSKPSLNELIQRQSEKDAEQKKKMMDKENEKKAKELNL